MRKFKYLGYVFQKSGERETQVKKREQQLYRADVGNKEEKI